MKTKKEMNYTKEFFLAIVVTSVVVFLSVAGSSRLLLNDYPFEWLNGAIGVAVSYLVILTISYEHFVFRAKENKK